MLRDITMIIAVVVSVLSVGFGVYERIEANNAEAFAYEQTYRILNIVQRSAITPFQRATIADAVLTTMGTPPPVIDLSRSSADVGSGDQTCTDVQRNLCTALAADLAAANGACARSGAGACEQADLFHREIIQRDCIRCFIR